MRELTSEETAKRWASYYSQLVDGIGDQKFKQEFKKYTHTHSWRNSVRIISEKAQIKNGSRILDAGCGWGRILLGLLERFSNLNVTALDFQKDAIIRGKSLIGAESNSNQINWTIGDLQSLDFEDNVFDCVYSARVFQHLNSPEVAAKELFRVLRPGGKFIVFVQNKWCPLNLTYYSRLYSPRQVKDWFIDVPVKDLKVKSMDFFPSSIGSGSFKDISLTVEEIVEKIPLINQFGGKVLISGSK